RLDETLQKDRPRPDGLGTSAPGRLRAAARGADVGRPVHIGRSLRHRNHEPVDVSPGLRPGTVTGRRRGTALCLGRRVRGRVRRGTVRHAPAGRRRQLRRPDDGRLLPFADDEYPRRCHGARAGRRPGGGNGRRHARRARLPLQPVGLAAPAGRARRRHRAGPQQPAARPRADRAPRRLRPRGRRPQRRRLMRRVPIEARPDWRRRAEDCGFAFHTIDGDAYWDESVYYAFTLQQVEDDIEDPTAELHAMAMDLAGEAAGSQELMERLAIPAHAQDQIAESWRRRDPHLYGRIDLAYDGRGPAKLYEFNYDTPTSLFEAAFFQWDWLERQREAGVLPADADQFNAIHEALVARFIELGEGLPQPLYFAAARDSAEDQGTVDYLRDCAAQAGIEAGALAMED